MFLIKFVKKNNFWYRMKLAVTKVEYSNADEIDGEILFDDKNLPLESKYLCPYCSAIISWQFLPLDVEDFL